MAVLPDPEGRSGHYLVDGNLVAGALSPQHAQQIFEESQGAVGDAWVPTRRDVNVERDLRIGRGFQFQINGEPHAFDSDPASITNIMGATQMATMAIINGAQANDLQWAGDGVDFVWITADDNEVSMDAPTVQNLGLAAAFWKKSHILAARVLKRMPGGIPADYKEDAYWPS